MLSHDKRARGVVVSRLLRMQKALGSNPSGSIYWLPLKHFVAPPKTKYKTILRGGIEPPTSRV
jgi:hypothetical protein